MENLIEILKKETETLKLQYVEMTENWAIKSYENMKNSDFLYFHTSGKYFQNRFGSTKSEDAMIKRVANIVNKGLEIYVKECKELAILHYETSVCKLANRISQKNLNLETLKIITSHIGVNIETVLSDGIKKVRAFTIIADGEVQRPHYRYLIK